MGLDIGYETLKLVQLSRRGNSVSLIGATEIPLTERILERETFKNKAATANLIKEAMRKAKPAPITAVKIVSALPETFVFSKTIKLPRMQAREYEEAVKAEVSQFLPIPLENAYLDYQILIDHPADSQVDILVVASPKKLVDDFVETAALAGLELIALETKPLAVGRALLSPAVKDGTLILHVGTEFSRISIWNESKIRLTSTVSVGKNQLLENLGLYVDLKTAKKKPEINADNKELIEEPITKIIDEVVSAIKYHQTRDSEPKPIRRIFLCGSAARIVGLNKIIEDEVGVTTTIAEIKLQNNAKLGPEFIPACGLALRDEY